MRGVGHHHVGRGHGAEHLPLHEAAGHAAHRGLHKHVALGLPALVLDLFAGHLEFLDILVLFVGEAEGRDASEGQQHPA